MTVLHACCMSGLRSMLDDPHDERMLSIQYTLQNLHLLVDAPQMEAKRNRGSIVWCDGYRQGALTTTTIVVLISIPALFHLDTRWILSTYGIRRFCL